MTCQLLVYHSSDSAYRTSIAAHGLLPHKPTEDGNYRGERLLNEQPRGIYLFDADIDNVSDDYDCRAVWYPSLDEDLWQIPYFGPVQPDPIVGNAIIVSEPIRMARLITDSREKDLIKPLTGT